MTNSSATQTAGSLLFQNCIFTPTVFTITGATATSTTDTFYPYPWWTDNRSVFSNSWNTVDAQAMLNRRLTIDNLVQLEIEVARERRDRRQPATPAIIRSDAAKRAEELLLEHLTEEQRKTVRDKGWFIVEGGKSGIKYRIRTKNGTMGNVDVMKKDKVTHRLCAHIDHAAGTPHADHLLAQKLMLEIEEDRFIKLANRHAA